MEIADRSIFTDQPTGYIACAPFVRLQRLGTFSDVRIVAKDGSYVTAHRVVLASRFPYIEHAMAESVDGNLKWQRFDRDSVEAVVAYAYTGNVEISMDNVFRLFLLATNLGCLTLTSWCIEFLKPRVSRDNIELVWSVANATQNADMMDICVSVIAPDFDSFSKEARFYSTTDLDSLASMLNDSRLIDVTEESKLQSILTWFEAKSIVNKENALAIVDEDLFLDTFHALVDAVDLSQITSHQFADFCMSGFWISLPHKCRNVFGNAWKEARTRVPLKEYLVAYTTPRKEMALSRFKRSRNANKNVSTEGIEILQADKNLCRTVPARGGCSVVVMGDSIFLIGGWDEKFEVTNKVDRVDPVDGQVLSAASMTQARSSCSAAAGTNGTQLFVFGGWNGGKIASSCEEFDLVTNSWTPLPEMLTQRHSGGSVSVPGVGVVVVGGLNGGALHKAELLTGGKKDSLIDGLSWRQLAPMIVPRSDPGIAYFQSRVVVAGGSVSSNIEVECLRLPTGDNDPGQWTKLHGLGESFTWFCSLVVLNERLLLADGANRVHEFVPASHSNEPILEEFKWQPLFTIQNFPNARLLVLQKKLILDPKISST